jgi:4'-phosphopantetheinyl transferase
MLVKGLQEFNNIKFVDSEIKHTNYNRPYFPMSNINFNITHSGEIVACAISSENRIGVDIEKIKFIRVKDFRFQMTELEWKRITDSENQISAFYCYWTPKESVIKAIGGGLSIPLKSFEINENETSLCNQQWNLEELLIDTKYKCRMALMVNQIIQSIN